MKAISSIPLLFFSILIYNVIALIQPWDEEQVVRAAACVAQVKGEPPKRVHPLDAWLKRPAFHVPTPSDTVIETITAQENSSQAHSPARPGQVPSEVVKPPPIEISAREKTMWGVTWGDLLLALSLLFLFFEVLNATGIQPTSIINHALSLFVLIIGLVEFLTLPQFATSVFFLIILMATLDVLAGFIVTIAAVRRDLAFVNN